MGEIAQDDLTWAERAAVEGRSLEFIASVLGVPKKHLPPRVKARATVDLAAKTVWHAKEHDDAARLRAEALFRAREEEELDAFLEGREPKRGRGRPGPTPVAIAPEERRDRRRFLLACRFARHWPMYWFLRGKGMRGRTLRSIYGAECCIWMVGGGVDVCIPQ